MARTNVEDQVWPRLSKLARILNCSDREATGTVVMLWRESQDILRISGTLDEITDWAHLFGMPDSEIDRWIDAMIRARILSRQDDGTYLIHGNEIQIESRLSQLKKSTKGGLATKEKWERIKAEREGHKPSTSPPEASYEQASGGQEPGPTKTRQDKTKQTKPRQTKAPPSAEFDFESLYRRYPRHEGKGEGMRRLASRVRDRETYELFAKSVDGYIAKAKYERTEAKYLKHWSSFVGVEEQEPWRDYIGWQPPAKPGAPPAAGSTPKLLGADSARVDAVLTAARFEGPAISEETLETFDARTREAVEQIGGREFLAHSSPDEIKARLAEVLSQPSSGKSLWERASQAQSLTRGLAGLKSMPEMRKGSA